MPSLKRLMLPSGEIVSEVVGYPSDTLESIVRPVILIHAGPNGSEISLESSDGELKFDAARIQAIVEKQNMFVSAIGSEYGGLDKMPAGAFPPVLDQHNSDSNDRICGRMKALLRYEVRDVPKVGKAVPCAVTDVTFLGAEAVKKVLDGRIYHMSVGISDDPEEPSYNLLGEVSTVIEPAAPGAMLLKKGKGVSMSKKRLAAQQARVKKLASINSELKTLSAKLVSSKAKVDLAKKETQVKKRLSKLVSEGKITPAEFKKMDVKKLSALPQESLDASLTMMEAMEPKVAIGQRGTTDAMNFSDMGKDMNDKSRKKLRAEIRGDFKRLGVKMKDDEDDKKDAKKNMSGGKEEMRDTDVSQDSTEKASGDKRDNSMEPEIPSVDAGSSVEEMQKQIDELSTQLARVCGMVSEMMSSEEGEEKELASGAEDDKKSLEDGEDDGGDAEMSGKAPEDEKKAAAGEEKAAPGEEKKAAAEGEEDKKDLAGAPAEGDKDKEEEEKKASAKKAKAPKK